MRTNFNQKIKSVETSFITNSINSYKKYKGVLYKVLKPHD